MSKNIVETDCSRRCKSRSHGQAITSAITKRASTDKSLATFIKATCANFPKAFDFEGRTAIHMAASRGRNDLMNWLIKHSTDAFINAKDRESGYTPLHRSIFYGQIHVAIELLKMGVHSDIVDKDDYRALDHAMLDHHYMHKNVATDPNDVYVWGSNSNYTLGTGTQQQRVIPELLSCFSRNNSRVEQVHLSKFHSVWLCSTGEDVGEVWCCGQIDRAGGPHTTALRPTLMKLMEPCVDVALTLNSTILLMQSGTILQYTLNSTDNSSPATSKSVSTIKLPSVKPLMKLSQPLGVVAGRHHGVVWNSRAVYTWGTNVGQLGHNSDEKVVPAPKRVMISMNTKEENAFQLVAASDAATVVTTSRGDVYLLHKHICKKIAIKQINLRQVCVEAKVSEQGPSSRVTVLLLTNVGQLLIWQDTINRVTRCVFGLAHQTTITQVSLTHDAMFFTTNYGEAFIGHISRKTTPTMMPVRPPKREKESDNSKSALVKFLEKDDCTNVRIVKIPNIHRAVSISVDSEGINFACLQTKPSCGLTSIPELSPTSMSKHMGSLMESAVDDDLLHDVVFKVGTKLYPAHIFIIASSSELLYKMYQEKRTSSEEKPIVVLENVLPEVFDRILKYIYTGSCDVTELGPCGLKIRREDVSNGKKEKESNDLEVDIVENPSEISAFEVYKSEKHRKSSKNRRSNETPPRVQNLYLDPVKLVQACAKRLQVLGLHKLLDNFFYRDGNIRLKDSASLTKTPSLTWSRERFPELVDTTVCAKDGGAISAHKCILAARLEYFQGMFLHSWTESKLLSAVTLPINHGILLPVINFLYTDTCPEVENADSIDFICSMMIVADQLFITRLREMCEVALANLVNLKNCHELCQFAHTYNASQLKQCCMEFISLNIGNVLENRTLDYLEEGLLKDITEYYCKFNPILSSRVITPFYNAPTDDFITEIEKHFTVDLEFIDMELKKDDSIIEISKKRSKSKKIEYTESEKERMRYESVSSERMRYESVSSVTSLDLSHDTSGDITLSLTKLSKETEKKKQEKWTEVPSALQKQQKIVQARMKAISNAQNILNETPTESFTKLSKSTSYSSSPIEVLPTSSRMSVSPKDTSIEVPRSPQMGFIVNHVGPKLSQKQRKKLAMQGSEQSHNLDDFLASKLNLNSPPDKPKNPWKIVEQPLMTSSPDKGKNMEFNQILADQKKQKENSSRIMTKPLTWTQLEDKAIEELERFYNVHESDDELITVRRIELQVSSPQWINTAPK